MGAALARGLLSGAAVCYGAVVGLRNVLYDRSWLASGELAVPVICVGNVTVGGTGKTPLVIWLCRALQKRGLKVALLSRGYKGDGEQGNDEIRMMREALPEVAILVGADRLANGRRAVAEYQAEVVVLDDGFGHRRLRRDLDVVTVDCTCPFGYGKLLPRGLLRESRHQLRRAGAVVLTRSDAIGAAELARLRSEIEKLVGTKETNNDNGQAQSKPIVYGEHRPVGLYNGRGEQVELAALRGKKVAAFCGIGNPQAFADTLGKLGAEVVELKCFDDHVEYDEGVFETVTALRDERQAQWSVTTEKDWVKLREFARAEYTDDLYWLKVEMVLGQGEAELRREIEQLWEKKQNRNTHRSMSVS